MTFGGGTNTAQDALDQFTTLGTTLDLQRYSNNFSLGSALTPNSTLFVQYRVGGGLATNLGTNVINQIGTVSFYVNGPSELTNSSVVNSLRCTNVTAAIGGAGLPSLEEIRNYVSFNFSAQKRAVTVQDYEALIRNMPAEFGAPAKVSITENNNKILIQLLSYDTSGKLTNIVSDTLRQNVATYLSNYRMMNDYISILTAEVIDLSVDVQIVLDSAQKKLQWNTQTLRLKKLLLWMIRYLPNLHKCIKFVIQTKTLEFQLKTSNQLPSLNRFILESFSL